MSVMAQKTDLPTSWELVPLGEFVVNEKGKKPKKESKEKTSDCSIPYIDIAAFEEGIIKSWTNGEGCRLCYEDDFLMVWDGSRSGLVGKGMSGALGSTLVRISFPGILNDYAFYFLRSKFTDINSRAKGVGIPHVDPNILWNYGFPIPPLNEQKRIVARIEELFSELDKGIENLKTARAQLKVYRQAVLKHAFEGKLTSEWREKNKDKLESADQLLSLIKREREEQYQQELKKYAANIKTWEKNGKKGKKPSKPSKPKSSSIERSLLPELPNGWVWENVGNLNTEIFDGPFGSNLKTSDYIDQGVRVIRLENIGQMEFIEKKYSYISEEKYDSIKKHTVRAGDIIFSSFIIENVRLVILPENIERAINKADCFCVRVHGKLVRTDYLATSLSTRSAYKQIESEIHGIGRPRINTTQLKNFLVPICSSAEQVEIMAELSKALSLILNAENTIDAELQKSEALRQSILKKAFSGQLVAQNPADEPASVLLERIRAEKENQSTKEKPKEKRRAA